jgi:predicted O-linked N-acetylglucosamine transferase (SPINDLY family)
MPRTPPRPGATQAQALETAFQEALGAHRAGDLARAEAGYAALMRAAPRHAGAMHMRALIAMAQGRLDAAETWLNGAAEAAAKVWEIRYDLGYLMELRGRDAAAEACYRQAIGLNPGCSEAYYNLAGVHTRAGRDGEAIAAYRATLGLDPGHLGAYNNLGLILRRQGHERAALDCFLTAARRHPDNIETLNNLATLCVDLREHATAAAYYSRLLRLDPDNGHAAGKLAHLARQLCEWRDLARLDAALARPETLASAYPVAPFDSLAGVVERPRLRAIARHHAERVCGAALTQPPMAPPRRARRRETPRVGYISGDMRRHPVTRLILGVLRAHDRQRFDIHLFSHGPGGDAARDELRALGHAFHDLDGLSDTAVAERVAAEEIDILVDLSGHTQHGRPGVNALRPAPIVVNWLGFPGSLGHERLADYIIGDATLTPLAHAGDYSEALALMPHCYQPCDDAQPVAAPPRRAEVGLPDTGVVFCSFNQAYKLTPELWSLWGGLLGDLPGSVLWLLEPAPRAAANLRAALAAQGIDPARLVFAPTLPMDQHLARAGLADIALDTFPYNSGATAGNMLWAGVPMVTLLGATYVARMGASLTRAAGLPELVADDVAMYRDIALRLARDPDRLRALKARLAAARATAPLFDTLTYTRDLERLFARMWSDHERGARDNIVLAAA